MVRITSHKLGLIVSDLEGTLTANMSYWKNLNLELGMTEKEDQKLYDEFLNHRDYVRWMEEILARWKEINRNFPEKLNRKFFHEFNRKHLTIMEGAREFIQYCKSHYIFYVISGAPWEFCELAKAELGFDDYYSTNKLYFNKDDQLERIEADKYGFQKEKIMLKIAESYSFKKSQIIAIGDSENDFTMLNAAGLGILVGRNRNFPSLEKTLKKDIIRLENLDFDRLKRIIAQYTEKLQTYFP